MCILLCLICGSERWSEICAQVPFYLQPQEVCITTVNKDKNVICFINVMYILYIFPCLKSGSRWGHRRDLI